MRIEELKQKEVINTCNCKILGCADDIEFDICTGCIEAIIVPEHGCPDGQGSRFQGQ
jgi:sporulation protein YlmC with PRC-barrel domain